MRWKRRFTNISLRVGRNCHRKSNAEIFPHGRRKRKDRQRDRARERIVSRHTERNKNFCERNEIEMRHAREQFSRVTLARARNLTEFRIGWNIDNIRCRLWIYLPGVRVIPVRAFFSFFFYDRSIPWIFYGFDIYISKYPVLGRILGWNNSCSRVSKFQISHAAVTVANTLREFVTASF